MLLTTTTEMPFHGDCKPWNARQVGILIDLGMNINQAVTSNVGKNREKSKEKSKIVCAHIRSVYANID
jgi:hypothetical protein